MMKNLFIFLGICSLLGCKTKQHSASNADDSSSIGNETTSMEGPESAIKLVAVIGDTEAESKPVQVLKSEIEGNLLFLTIGYSGGCAEHTFTFVGSNMIAKSLPPIRNVNLLHDTDDTCREYIEKELVVDLSALAYKQESGSQIKLSYKGSKEYLLYTYED
jgi:hypothetical protein